MHALGAAHVRVLRGVEDGPAYRAGLINTVTAHDLALVLAAIAQDRAASPNSCAEMRRILLGQEFNEGIPAGLPPHTPVAHKTGWVEGLVRHDAAIVYPPNGSALRAGGAHRRRRRRRRSPIGRSPTFPDWSGDPRPPLRG